MSRVTFTQRSVTKVYELHAGLELLATVTWNGQHNPASVVYPSWANVDTQIRVFALIDKLKEQEAAAGTSGVLGGEEDEERGE